MADDARPPTRTVLTRVERALRTPLGSLLEHAAELHVGARDGAAREALRDLLSSARALDQVLDEVLLLAELDVDALSPRPTLVRVDVLCRELAGAVGSLAALRRQRVRCSVHVESAVLDVPKVRPLLLDALAHALGCTADGGDVALRALPTPAGGVRFEVEDGGADDVTGLLGPRLALLRYLVEAQGGSVGVVTLPTRGHLFFLALPECAA